jgi:iron complex transport system ATP-binding protein
MQMQRLNDVRRYKVDELNFPEDDAQRTFPRERLSGELTLSDVSFGYSPLEEPLLTGFNMHLRPGGWVAVVGASGSGKSTLVRAISGAVRYSGTISYLDGDIRRLRPGELARNIGILAQNHYVGYAFTVREVVRLGRYAYKRDHGDPEGEERIRQALEATGMDALADKSVLHLSGGELQQVFLAQLFAQDPRVLILDEPTNHLDLIYQKQVFELVSRWREEPGRAVISVVHDLSLARAYGTKALLLYERRALAQGGVDHVFDPAYLNAAYGMDVAEWMRTMLGQWT